MGGSRGWDGIWAKYKISRSPHQQAATVPARLTNGKYPAVPVLNLQVVDGELVGLPDDLRGTGGPPGGRIMGLGTSNPPLVAVGGTGGAGGAGLAIVCRGMSFGASASINLSGASTTSPPVVSVDEVDYYPGAGGPGGPGTLLILLDGNNLSIPVITGKFVATTGSLTQSGNPMPSREGRLIAGGFATQPEINQPPHCGYADPALAGPWEWTQDAGVVMSALDMSNSAHHVFYIPIPQQPTQDDDPRPPAPSGLVATTSTGANVLTWTSPDLDSFDVIDIFASIDNNRTNAEKVGDVRGQMFIHQLPLGGLRYYWIRAKINPVSGRPAVFSEWEPVDPNEGVVSNADTPGEIEEAPDDFSATGRANGIQFNWSLPWAKLSGLLRLYEHTAATPFSAATLLWEGYNLGIFIPKGDTTTRYYWLTLSRGAQESVPEPPITGLAAAASSATSVLSAICAPDSVARSATIGPNPRFVITPITTCVATGGTAPYTYAWTWQSGGTGITITDPTFDDTAFSASGNLDGTVLWGVALCTVTDSLAATASATCQVQISFPSIG